MKEIKSWTSSAAQIGRTVTLSSSKGNHPPKDWARATAQIIFDIHNPPATRLLAAIDLQDAAANALTKYYHAVIEREAERLSTFPDQCDAPSDVIDLATQARDEVQRIAAGSPWDDLIHSDEWTDAAFDTIKQHLETAVHVERLLFADANPTNHSAIAYKRRF